MHKSWLVCVFLGVLAWGQARPETTPAQAAPASAGPASAGPAKAPAPVSEVPENAVVLTIKGVCAPVPKTTAASKTGPGKTAAAKKPADCKTELTRAQIEKIGNAVSPTSTITPQLKRQLQSGLPRIMAMSEAAKEKGLDKSPRFVERMKIDRMQILATELQRSVQEEADKVPEATIADYYKKNPEAYEQFSLERLFIPRYKTADKEDKDEAKEPEKLTEEQQKAKEAADKAKQEEGEQELNKLADSLRERAAAGGDFAALQKEAFEAAGTKIEKPTVALPKVRRTGLPAAHAAVFDLKVGEVSAVISDNGGHYIYKVVGMEVLPLDQVREEIHGKLKTERLKEMMDKYTNSFQVIPNEAYFGPPMPAGPGGRPPMQMAPHMHPPTAPPPPAANAPAQQPPPNKPN